MNTADDINWPILLALQDKALEASDESQLAFVIGNETWHLVPYRQAALYLIDVLGHPQLRLVSGLVGTLEDTPFTVWMKYLGQTLMDGQMNGSHRRLTAHDLPQNLREGWAEWFPEHALWLPLNTPAGRNLGAVLLVRDEAWNDDEIAVLTLLHKHYAYCMNTLSPRRQRLAEWWQKQKERPQRLKLISLALGLMLFLPVRLSVLAPAEIIALKAEAIAAPTEGVVKAFHVTPNQPVKAGQPLFSLDDTTLRNRRDIAAQTLAVARSDSLAAGQKAFDSQTSKGDLAMLQGKVREKEAEVAYIDELLQRIDVLAPSDGILIYSDPNDWIGKPVVTGERIAQLAQPQPLGVQVWVPVGDAISLESGADIRVYLQVSPLNSLSATLVETSYQATMSPDNIAAYKVRGRLSDGDSAHIGLRGVAKVYGGWRPFIYWVVRRPLGALRQWIGV